MTIVGATSSLSWIKAVTDFELSLADAADGARIAYFETKAETVPLVALSGGPGWDHRYLRIGGAFDMIGLVRRLAFIDLRGAGRSSVDGPKASIGQFVDDIEAVRGALDAPRIDLFGHSFGSYLAIAYAAKHPGKARSLILASSASPRFGDTPQLFDLVYPDKIAAWRAVRPRLDGVIPVIPTLAPFHAMEFAHRRAHDLYVRSVTDHCANFRLNNHLRREMAELDYTAALAALTAPALVLHGRWDAIVALASGWAIHRSIRGSRFQVFEESGHSPFVEEPVAFADAVTGFLAKVDRAAGEMPRRKRLA